MAVGGTHTLIGHSERRQYFAETDEIVNKKLHTALKHGVVPIVCIGEVLAEREAGKTASVLQDAGDGRICGHHARGRSADRDCVRAGVGHRHRQDGDAGDCRRRAPHHSRGSGQAAGRRCGRGHAHPLRRQREAGQRDRADGQEEIDGALVGGASLKPDSFTAIVKY